MKCAAITIECSYSLDERPPVADMLLSVIRWIQIAASYDAAVVIFPEYVLGHYHKDPIAIDSPEIMTVSRCALENGVVVCIGIGEICEKQLYSTYVILNIDGTWSFHRKTRWQTPHCPISLGTKVLTHNIHGVKTGIMICSESRYPDVAKRLAIEGAKLLIMPHAYGIGGPNWVPFKTAISNIVSARCSETGIPAVVIGNTGKGFQGGCALVSADGTVLYENLENHELLHQFNLSNNGRITLGINAEQTPPPYTQPAGRVLGAGEAPRSLTRR